MTSYFNTGDKIIDYKDKIPYVENDTNTLSVSNKQFNYVIPYSYQQQRKLFVLKMFDLGLCWFCPLSHVR